MAAHIVAHSCLFGFLLWALCSHQGEQVHIGYGPKAQIGIGVYFIGAGLLGLVGDYYYFPWMIKEKAIWSNKNSVPLNLITCIIGVAILINLALGHL